MFLKLLTTRARCPSSQCRYQFARTKLTLGLTGQTFASSKINKTDIVRDGRDLFSTGQQPSSVHRPVMSFESDGHSATFLFNFSTLYILTFARLLMQFIDALLTGLVLEWVDTGHLLATIAKIINQITSIVLEEQTVLILVNIVLAANANRRIAESRALVLIRIACQSTRAASL